MRSLKTLKQVSRGLKIPLATREEMYQGTRVTRWSEGGGGNFLKAKIRVIVFLLSDRPELLNVTCSTHFFGLKPYLFKKDAVKFQTPLR